MRKTVFLGGVAAVALASVSALAVSTESRSAPASQAASPSFAGKYQGTRKGVDAAGTVKPTGKPNQYTVHFEAGAKSMGGDYCTDSIDGTGTVRGNVLTIRSTHDWDERVCTMTTVQVGGRTRYRVSGCEGTCVSIDGDYTRALSQPARR